MYSDTGDRQRAFVVMCNAIMTRSDVDDDIVSDKNDHEPRGSTKRLGSLNSYISATNTRLG